MNIPKPGADVVFRAVERDLKDQPDLLAHLRRLESEPDFQSFVQRMIDLYAMERGFDSPEYRYGLSRRPADIGAVPSGYYRVDPPDPDYPEATRYGVVVYPRLPKKEEVDRYELARYYPASQVEEEIYVALNMQMNSEEMYQGLIDDMMEDPKFYQRSLATFAEPLQPFFSNRPFQEILKDTWQRIVNDKR